MEAEPTIIKNKKKKWVLLGITLITILIFLGIAMADEIIAKVAPDKYVMLSLLEMQKTIEKENKGKETWQVQNQRTNLDLNLKEISGIYVDDYKEIIEGIGISLNIAKDQNRDITIDTAFKKNGSKLMSLNIYSSDSQLGVNIPEIINQYVMIDLDKFKEQYDQSPLAYYGGSIDQEEVDLFKNGIKQVRQGIFGEIQEDNYVELKEAYKDAFIDVAKGIHIKYTGKNKKNTTFSINIDSGDIKSLVKESIKASLRNKDIKQSIESMMLASGSYYTIDELAEEIYEELNEVKFSDVEINCEIDNKRRMVKAELTTGIEVDGEKAKIQADYLLGGKKDIFDKVEVNMSLKVDDESIQLSLDKDKTYAKKDTQIIQETTLKIRQDKAQVLKLNYNVEQDLKAKEDNYIVTANITTEDDLQMNFKLMGDLIEDQTNHMMNLEANNITLSIGTDEDQIQMSGSGSFGIQDLKQELVGISDKPQVNLFSMSEQEMFGLFSQIGQQLYYMQDLGNIFY